MSDNQSFTLEINEKYTRVCDIQIKSNKVEIESLGYLDTVPYFYANDSEQGINQESEIIKQLFLNLKIKKKNVNIIIPDIYTYSQIIEMPTLKEKELLAAIRYQADEFIPMPIEDTYLDLEILKEDAATKKTLIFIVASPKKIVDQIQTTVEMAGLTPIGLENELSVLGRMYSQFYSSSSPEEKTAFLFMNVGYTSTSLYLFDTSSKLIILVRTFKIGLNLFIRDISANLSLDEKKALECLKTIGTSSEGPYNIDAIISPIIKEMSHEVQKILVTAQDKYGLQVKNIYTYNFDNMIYHLTDHISQYVGISTSPLNIKENIVDNPIAKSFSESLTSFVSVIAGNL